MELIPYARNSRTHSDEQIAQIMASIKEFGFTNPILTDGDNGIIAGHGRLMAAQRLGLNEVPTIELSHLTEAQKKAYIIADNKLALNSGWDDDMLKIELQELYDIGYDVDIIGFTDEELEDMDIDLEGDLKVIDESKADDVPEIVENPVIKIGDLIELGNHRLLCGDSTKEEDVARLMDGKKADMVFTDPPYNIDYQGVSDKRDKIKNDKMSDKDFINFLKNALMPCETMYVCCSWQYSHLFKEAMEDMSRKPKAMIIWNKVNPAQHLDKYFKQHEIIFYYGDFGGQKTLRGDIWECKRQRNTVHPTMKPVELIEIALGDQEGKILVQDSFLGSGSTLIACENLNRKCYGMELDEKYAQVIVQRWCDYTQIDTIKINGKEVSWNDYKLQK